MKQQFEVKYSGTEIGILPYIIVYKESFFFNYMDEKHVKHTRPDKVFIEMVHSNGDFDYPKKYIPKLQDGCVILIRDEVEKVQKPKVADKIIFFCRYCDNEVSVRDAACDDCIGITPTQSDISLDAAELKKAIQLKNEGWADSLEFKIWSLAYENNSEENYRSVIEEIEKLQPKIIEQIDVDKAALAYAHEHPALRGVIRAFKAGSSWQQSHPPVTSMGAEEFYNQEMGHLSIIKPTVVINALTKYASYVLANSDKWSDEQLLQLCLDFKGYTTGNESIQYIDLYGTPYKEQLQNFLTQYKQK